MSTLTLNSSFGQHTIDLSVDPATHLLSDPGTTAVHRNETVTWEKTTDDIEWFRIQGAQHPFINLPSRNWPDQWTGHVWSGAPYRVWKYTITYKLKGNSDPQLLDPKIAVNPVPPPFSPLILLLVSAITAILAIVFFVKWQRVKAKYEDLLKSKT